MKNLKFALVLLMVSMISCDEDSYLGSGDMITETRNLAEFSEIKTEGIFKVYIEQGDVQEVQVVADDNIVHRLKTRVIGDKLNIFLEKGNYRNIEVEIFITVKNLTKIINEGTGDILAYDFFNNEQMTIENSGTGDIEVTGSANSLYLKNVGSGNIIATELSSNESTVRIEGSGDCKVLCEDYLKAYIEGSGNIYYLGNPIIDSEIEGSGKIESIN